MNDFEITKREILFSIIIVSVMLIIGFIISGHISDEIMTEQQEYNLALEIDNDTYLFKHSMETDIGNAFVYGELKAVDKVSYPEIKGKYMYIEKVKERYTRHTRQVPHTRIVNGKTTTYYTTETYYTWDRIDSWSKHSEKISFCGIEFKYGKINIPSDYYIDTIKESRKIRYKYYGVDEKYTGTIYAKLENNMIPDNTRFYKNMNIGQVKDSFESNFALVGFWIFWILLTGGVVFGFYYLDNKWLEDKK